MGLLRKISVVWGAFFLLLSAPVRAEYCTVSELMDVLPQAQLCRAGAQTLSIAGVGDVLPHSPLQRQGATYGFQTLWQAAEPWFLAADLAYANLETPTAPGIGKNFQKAQDPGPIFDGWVYSSYPLFNTPPMLLHALKNSGVDLISTANNHALDRGSFGVDRTIEEINNHDLAFTGTRKKGDLRAFGLDIKTKMGIVWVIACTYSTNGIPDPHNQVLECFSEKDTLLAELRHARQRPEVALILVTPHWGVEYTHKPTERQKELARQMVEAGADAIIGTHPHVVQPLEFLTAPDGRQVPVAYSTGNFVSGQTGLPRRVGYLVWLEFCRGSAAQPGELNLLTRAVAMRAGWKGFFMRTGGQRRLVEISLPAGDAQDGLTSARNLAERVSPGFNIGGQVTCQADVMLPVLQ